MAQIFLTGQNIDVYDGDGLDPFARTGATTAVQLHNAGAEGVILGHSEVGDSPEIVAAKLQTILKKQAVTPDFLKRVTLLVGETYEEAVASSPQEIGAHVCEHLGVILMNVPGHNISGMVIGYEPKWGSRGSGRDDMPPPEPDIIHSVSRSIRDYVIEKFGEEVGGSLSLIYGGRSSKERTKQILQDQNVSGLILGSACNSVEKTMGIAEAMTEVQSANKKVLHANFKAYELADPYGAYIDELRTLDDSFDVYLSPCHTDIREVKALLP